MTVKEKLFIEAYLGVARCNATEAARIAGYSQPRQSGSENLSKPSIKEEIARHTAEIAGTADEVLQTLARQMRGPTEDCFSETGDLDLAKLKEAGLTSLIQSIRKDKWGNIVSVKLYDSQAAAALLGKHHGILVDKIVHSGEVVSKVYVGAHPKDMLPNGQPDDNPD